METRIAVIAIIAHAHCTETDELNRLLSAYSEYIVGRMGIPYRQKGVNIISIAVDAPPSEISSLSGKLGRLHGVSVKTAYAPADAV